MYMQGTVCTACPTGSSVLKAGSIAVSGCVCKVGYHGTNGGAPCTACATGTTTGNTASTTASACKFCTQGFTKKFDAKTGASSCIKVAVVTDGIALKWSFAACKPVNCADPPKVANSKQLASPTTFGSVRAYICLTGYEIKANAAGQKFGDTIRCTNTFKWEAPLVCALLDCTKASLPTVANAQVKASVTTFGSKASVRCSSGFTGSATISCLASGKWSDPPVCCGAGTISSADGKTCETCAAGKYSQAGACVTCDACAAGQVESRGCSAKRNRICTACAAGSTFADDKSKTCKGCRACSVGETQTSKCTTTMDAVCTACGSGTFSKSGVCTACRTCIASQINSQRCAPSTNRICAKCDAGKYSDANNAASCKVCVGKRVNAKQTGCESCPVGFTFSSGTCKPVDCKEPGAVANSKQLASATTFNSVRSYICLTGYEVAANAAGQKFGASIKCLSTGKWATRPVCKLKDCGKLPTVANATVTSTATTFGAKADVACVTGFTGESKISCTASGIWTDAAACAPATRTCNANNQVLDLSSNTCVCRDGSYDGMRRSLLCWASAEADSSVRTGLVCKTCPPCMTCSRENITINVGFALVPSSTALRDSQSSSLWAARCPNTGSCQPYAILRASEKSGARLMLGSTSDSRCAAGSSGVLCAQCDESFRGGNGKPCVACDADGASSPFEMAIAGVVALLALGLILKFHGQHNDATSHAQERARMMELKAKKDRVMTLVRIAVSTWQLLASLPGVLDVELPGGFARLVAMASAVNLDVFKVLSLGCVQVGFFSKFMASMAMPIVLGALIVAYYKSKGRGLNEMQNGLVLLSFLIYPSVSSKVFQVFSCQDISPTESYHRLDYSMDCNGTEYAFFYKFGLLCLCVYPLGIPLTFALMMYKNRQALFTDLSAAEAEAATDSGGDSAFAENLDCDDDKEANVDLAKTFRRATTKVIVVSAFRAKLDRVHDIQDNFAFLCGSYENRIFYWELVEYLRKFLLAGVLVFVEPGSASQVFVALIISFFYFATVTAFGPYISDDADR